MCIVWVTWSGKEYHFLCYIFVYCFPLFTDPFGKKRGRKQQKPRYIDGKLQRTHAPEFVGFQLNLPGAHTAKLVTYSSCLKTDSMEQNLSLEGNSFQLAKKFLSFYWTQKFSTVFAGTCTNLYISDSSESLCYLYQPFISIQQYFFCNETSLSLSCHIHLQLNVFSVLCTGTLTLLHIRESPFSATFSSAPWNCIFVGHLVLPCSFSFLALCL